MNTATLSFIEWLYSVIGYQEPKTVLKPQPPKVLDEDLIYDGGTLPEVVVTAKRLYIIEWSAAARRALSPDIETVQLMSLMTAWHEHGTGDDRHLAYIFASIWHECHFEPKNERRANPLRQPSLYRQQAEYWDTGYFGRGPIQLTWEDNYARFGKYLGLPLLRHPELVNKPEIGYKIAVIGMVRGWFTGAPLRWYINDAREDYVKARRTVNGDEYFNGASIARDAKRILEAFQSIKL